MLEIDTKDIIQVAIVGAGTLIIGILVGEISQSFGLIPVSLGLVFILVLIFIYAFCISYSLKTEYHEVLKKIDSYIILSEKNNTSIPEWLFSWAELNQIEKNYTGKDIWIISPTLDHDTANNDLTPILLSNAKKGIKYTYIVPDNELIESRIRDLERIFANHIRQVNIFKFSEKRFSFMFSTHLVVYNPNKELGMPSRVFQELPVDGRDWWVEMTRDNADKTIGIISKLLEDYHK
jgi:hypothetical protein